MHHIQIGDSGERIHDNHEPHAPLSRRRVLAGLGAVGLTAASARPSLGDLIKPVVSAQATNRAPSNTLFRIERVSEGVYAAIAKPAAMINCNAAIIVGSDHVLIVDSHSKPSAARALIEQIRSEITDHPVRYVINSHFHWDHTQGNPAYPQAFGASTEIISSMATREWLAREGMGRLQDSLGSVPKQVSDLRTQLTAIKTPPERERLELQIAELESYGKEMAQARIVLPTITFDQRMVIHRDGREIHLLFLGRGHTAGDIVVFIPSERVVATGDLMHSVLPYIADGYPEEWPRTLTALEALAFDRLVPGHGSVQQGKFVLAFFRNYLEELNEAVKRGIERGASLAELQRALAPDRLLSLNSGGQLARLEREAQLLLGTLTNPNDMLKSRVSDNVAEIYQFYSKQRVR